MRSIVCIGYAKCGTTLLDEAVRKVDGMLAPREGKEIKFFLPRNFPGRRKEEKYYENFDIDLDSPHPTFEASPQYLHQKFPVFLGVLKNIKETIANPTIVICLRHPVLRAYSHYVHNLQEFALHGEGVFNKRADLLRKGCRLSFEEALVESPRLMTRYAEGICAAIRMFGRDRVRLFFLESDSSALGDWMVRNVQVSPRMTGKLNEIGNGVPVFSRRPIPNYFVDGRDVVAYGAGSQQIVRYVNLTQNQIESLKRGQEKWTTRLAPEEIARMLEIYFSGDLKLCAEMTGDSRFLDYLNESAKGVVAKLSDESLLNTVHRYNAEKQE